MSYLEGTKEFKDLIEHHSSLVLPRLENMTSQLIAWVDSEKIHSFEFCANMINGKAEGLILFITPNTKNHKRIQLGKEPSNIEFHQSELDTEILTKIQMYKEYVDFINQYLPNTIPQIRRPTKYRLDKSVTKQGFESDQPKVPPFAQKCINS